MPMKKLKPIINPVFTRVDAFEHDMRLQGWLLNQDTGFGKDEFYVSLIAFLEPEEISLKSAELQERFRQKHAIIADQHHVEAMWRQQDQLPETWRSFDLIEAGTIWLDTYGCPNIAYLQFCLNRWYVRFKPIAYDFGERCRMLCISW